MINASRLLVGDALKRKRTGFGQSAIVGTQVLRLGPILMIPGGWGLRIRSQKNRAIAEHVFSQLSGAVA
ncbi:hypothetical protein B2M20_01740 [Nitrobacter vulgaris]|uniref:Uncharacterized protein n=1 Tax=Nitrobacter vulgaris TaxID=29421 RepID=A0A1V4I2P8_NITVU|nr:hypothetical protein B2M20_01740 [Nitrobacter vulgaris]